MHIEQSSQEHLVRGLAHRMNNILTLFHGYVGMLLDSDSIDKTMRANLGKIKEGACAASELMDRTNSLVRPARLISREMDLPFLLGLLRPAFQSLCGPNTRLVMELPPEMKPIWTDATQVKRALMELVRNACESTADSGGTVRVTVRCEHWAEEGGEEMEWVSLTVTDDGPGITRENAERMFQPFYTTRKRKQAAGLGLNVATEAVQQLGGLLTHSSKRGETKFTIRLPMRTGPAEETGALARGAGTR